MVHCITILRHQYTIHKVEIVTDLAIINKQSKIRFSKLFEIPNILYGM